MKSRCKDCGANIKPACASCEHYLGDINQRWVEKECRESHSAYLHSSLYRRNKYLYGCVRAFDDKMYDEGSW